LNPSGALSSDQTHKARINLTAKLPLGKGFISYAWSLKYDSGAAFSARMANATNASTWYAAHITGNAGFAGWNASPLTSSFNRFYDGRGNYRYPDTYTVDFKASFELPLLNRLRLMGEVKVNNFFNHQMQYSINNTFTSSTLTQAANPGVKNVALFGTDNDNYAYYIAARTVSASVGLKF